MAVHIDEWVTACDNLNIKISAQAVQDAVMNARRQRDSSAGTEYMAQADGQNESRQPFTLDAFRDALVEWIVADDQVRYCLYLFARPLIHSQHRQSTSSSQKSYDISF